MDSSRISGINFDFHNPGTSSKLVRAVQARDITAVRRLLKQGKSPNEPDNRGYTALHEASRADDFLDIAKVLLTSTPGAYIEHKTVEGDTPLSIACISSCEKIVEYYLSHNCVVNNANIDGVTPLHIACSKRNLRIVEMLLKAGADINAKDNEMLTPLFYAIECENVGAVKMLLDAGCDVDTVDYFSRTPLQFSCMGGNLEIFDILVEHLGVSKKLVNYQTTDGWTLLMEAVQFRSYSIAEKLISYGADTSLVDIRGMLALHLAAHCDRTDCLELIIRHTPKDSIERYATIREDLTHTRSLPCLLIDKDMFDGLKLLFEYGVSDEVLSCPAKMGDNLVSPVSFLMLHANGIPDKKKVKYLELLLTKEALKDPTYDVKGLTVTRSVEAAVRGHKASHRDCHCEVLLAMLLNEGVRADVPFQGSSGIPEPYLSAIDSGFVKGLALMLAHSNLFEPEDVLTHLLQRVDSSARSMSKNEEEAAAFLVWAATDTRPHFQLISRLVAATPENPQLLSLLDAIKIKKFAVPSLRSLSCRYIRSVVRLTCSQRHPENSPSGFRNAIKSLRLPPLLINYLLYEHLLSY